MKHIKLNRSLVSLITGGLLFLSLTAPLRAGTVSILVSDGQHSILRYNGSGQYQGVYLSDAARLNNIVDIALESDQNYLDVLTSAGKIVRYGTGRTAYLGTPVTGLNHATDFEVAASGRYVVENGTTVSRYSTGDNTATFLNNVWTGKTGLQDMVRNLNLGNMYATASGNILKDTWGDGDPFTWLTGTYYDLAISPDYSYLYASDASSRTIKKINASDGTVTSFATLDLGDTGAGLTVDSSGNLYVASGTVGGFYSFNSSGTELFRFGEAQGVVGAQDFIIVSGLTDVPVLSTPEPSMLGMFGIGALVCGGYAWRKKKRTA